MNEYMYCVTSVETPHTLNRLGVFLFMIYLRSLVWDFSAEIVSIALVMAGVGGVGALCRTIRYIFLSIAFAISMISVYGESYQGNTL